MVAVENKAMGTKASEGKRGRPKESERNDVSVKIDRTLVGKARLVATHKGISMAQLLSDIIKGPLDRFYAQMVRELGEAEKGSGQ